MEKISFSIVKCSDSTLKKLDAQSCTEDVSMPTVLLALITLGNLDNANS